MTTYYLNSHIYIYNMNTIFTIVWSKMKLLNLYFGMNTVQLNQTVLSLRRQETATSHYYLLQWMSWRHTGSRFKALSISILSIFLTQLCWEEILKCLLLLAPCTDQRCRAAIYTASLNCTPSPHRATKNMLQNLVLSKEILSSTFCYSLYHNDIYKYPLQLLHWILSTFASLSVNEFSRCYHFSQITLYKCNIHCKMMN